MGYVLAVQRSAIKWKSPDGWEKLRLNISVWSFSEQDMNHKGDLWSHLNVSQVFLIERGALLEEKVH